MTLTPNEVEDWCDENDGELLGDGYCVIEGKDGSELGIEVYPTQTTEQNTVEFKSSDGLMVSTTTDPESVTLNPDKNDIYGHAVGAMADDLVSRKDGLEPLIAFDDGGTRTVAGVKRE